jgi:uncharacterized protein with HEPN domain
MNFIVIGEMVSKLSTEIKHKSRDIPWREIKNLRNILAHNYFGVDPEVVWQIAKQNLPSLKEKLNGLIS